MVDVLLLAPRDRVERLSDALIDELGALSVSIEDADAGTPGESAWFGEPGLEHGTLAGWLRSALHALFPDEEVARIAVACLLAQPWAAEVRLGAITALPDRDWVRLTQSQFAPVAITEDFWIVPSWHDPPDPAARVIRLDPGLAFGTGTHPTTRMCLRWIAREALARSARWHRVLDYGCGSGILAIAAALHGARSVDAVDLDPAAVASTLANALANRCSNVVAGTPDLARAGYGLVMANILAAPLKLIAPLLSAHVENGGDLVLSGILERQGDELCTAYAPWLALTVADVDEGWLLMTAHRSI